MIDNSYWLSPCYVCMLAYCLLSSPIVWTILRFCCLSVPQGYIAVLLLLAFWFVVQRRMAAHRTRCLCVCVCGGGGWVWVYVHR